MLRALLRAGKIQGLPLAVRQLQSLFLWCEMSPSLTLYR